MATPPISHEKMMEAYDAVKQHGSIIAAAEALGVHRSTLQHRYFAALRVHGLPETRPAIVGAPLGVIAPVLKTSNTPVEDLIAQRKAEFLRTQAATQSEKWMRFEIEEEAPFAIVFAGDPHVDDRHCDWPTLEKHLNLIEQTPGMFAVGLGDWTNNWTGKLTRLYAEQPLGKKEAWQLAAWVLRRPIWMLLLRGNHDMWSGAGDPLEWLSEGTVMVDWQAQFEIACGSQVWRINAAHDFPGSSIWNRLHAPLRKAKMSGFEADLYIAGHRHNWGIAHEQDDHTGRVAWIARAKGYKAHSVYETQRGYGHEQSAGQSIAAVFSPHDRKLRCFADLEEAAQYLAWMRAR